MDPNNINNQGQIPPTPLALGDASSYQERMRQAMEAKAEQDRKEETWAVRSPRLAYERAKERLEQVNRPYGGNYSYEEKRAAKEDLEEKEKAYLQVANAHAREKYLAGLEEKKKAEGEVRAAQEAKQLAENEGRLREAMRARYPGSDEDFVKDWPELKREHYRRQTLDQMSRPRVTPF